MFQRIFTIICLVLLVFSPTTGFAQDKAVTGPYHIDENTPLVLSPEALEEVAAIEFTYEKMFHRAFSKISIGDMGGASAILRELRSKAFEEEYLNLSSFSIDLLDRARKESAAGNHVEARFLASWAETLSPEDSKVQLIIASLKESIGSNGAFSAFRKSLQFASMSPLFVSKFMVNAALLALVGMTLSLFLVCLIQLARNSELLVLNISKKFPDNYKGLIGPPFVLLLLVVPLYFGLLPALACWSLLLSRYVKSCRWLAALVGAIILSWSLGLPTIEKVAWQVSTPINEAIENVNNRTYSPRDEKALLSALELEKDNPILLFTQAQILRRAGKLDKAATIYQSLVDSNSKRAAVHKKSLLNLAGIYYLQKKFEKAELLLQGLEKLKEDSFEFYYNYAHVKLALLDTEGNRKFYKLASDSNEARIEWLKKYKVAERKQVFTELPRTSFYPTFIKPTEVETIDGQEVAPASLSKVDVIFQSLVRDGSVVTLLALGLITFFLGLAIRFTKKMLYRHLVEARPFFGTRRSKIWHGMPAGGYIAGSQPIVGAFLLAMLIAFSVAAFGKPLDLISLTPIKLPISSLMTSLTIMLFLFVSASSLIFVRDSRGESNA